MDKSSPHILISIFNGCRIGLHLLYGILLAVFFPHMAPANQRRTLKIWSRKLLAIFNIGIQSEGLLPARDEGAILIVANHVSWLDIFILNAIYPSRFIAKSEVRNWPLIGWLCKRSGTVFIERAVRQDASKINQRISLLLKQGIPIGIFPEGTTTDGRQAGHFHSSLIQPAIDAGASLCPIALRYLDEEGEPSAAAPFIGDMTLAQSIWRILRCPHLNAMVVFTPALPAAKANRRVLARMAQQAIAQRLMKVTPEQPEPEMIPVIPHALLSGQSAYVLLLDPLLKYPG